MEYSETNRKIERMGTNFHLPHTACRGADASERQLRDDLMTMLIAGHETTAAMLTWATFCLLTNPSELDAVREEVDRVLGGRRVEYGDIMKLEKVFSPGCR